MELSREGVADAPGGATEIIVSYQAWKAETASRITGEAYGRRSTYPVMRTVLRGAAIVDVSVMG